MIAWFMPIFRQFKTKWLLFFLVLGTLDPLMEILNIYFNLMGFWGYNLGSLLLYLSLYKVEGKKIKEADYLLIAMLFATMFMLPEGAYFLFVSHAIIFYKILSYAIIELHLNDRINFPLLALVLYELSVLIKFIVYLNGDQESYTFFTLTLFFETGIAILFTIFRIDDVRLVKSLKE